MKAKYEKHFFTLINWKLILKSAFGQLIYNYTKEYLVLAYTNLVMLVFQAIWLVRYLWLMDIVHLLGGG